MVPHSAAEADPPGGVVTSRSTGPSRRGPRRAALVLAWLGVVVTAGAVLLPTPRSFADHRWVMSPGERILIDPTDPLRHEVVLDLPCAPSTGDLDVRSSTTYFLERAEFAGRDPVPGAGVVLEVHVRPGSVTVQTGPGATSDGTRISVATDNRGPDCRATVESRSTGRGAVVILRADPEERVLRLEPPDYPRIAGLEVIGDGDAEIVVEARLHRLESATPSVAAKSLRWAGASLASAAVVLWASSRRRSGPGDPASAPSASERERWIAGAGWRTAAVVAVALVSAGLVSPMNDDGWILARARVLAGGSEVLLDTSWRGVVQMQGAWYEGLLALLVPTTSLLVLRLLNVLAVIAVWVLIERIAVGLGHGRASRRTLLTAVAIWIVAVPDLVRTLRPEAMLALLLAIVLAQHGARDLHRRTLAVSVTLPAAAAVALHQAGWVVVLAGVPLVLAASLDREGVGGPPAGTAQQQDRRGSSRPDVGFLAGAAAVGATLGVLVVLADLNVDVFLASTTQYNAYWAGRPSIAPLLEFERYRHILKNPSLPHHLFGFGGPIAALLLGAALVRRRLLTEDRVLAAAAACSTLGLLLTSSKWRWHVLPAAIVVIVAVLVLDASRPRPAGGPRPVRDRSLAAVGVATVLVLLAALPPTASATPYHAWYLEWYPPLPRVAIERVHLGVLVAFSLAATALLFEERLRGRVRGRHRARSVRWDPRWSSWIGIGAMGAAVVTATVPSVLVSALHRGALPAMADLVMPRRATVPLESYRAAAIAAARVPTILLALIGLLALVHAVMRRDGRGVTAAVLRPGSMDAGLVLPATAVLLAALTVTSATLAPVSALLGGRPESSVGSAMLVAELRGDGLCGLLDAADPRTAADEPWVAAPSIVAEAHHSVFGLFLACLPQHRPVDGRWTPADVRLEWSAPREDPRTATEAVVACFANPWLQAPCVIAVEGGGLDGGQVRATLP